MIQEASLVDNYRALFARIIKGGSFKDLPNVLQARMAEEHKP